MRLHKIFHASFYGLGWCYATLGLCQSLGGEAQQSLPSRLQQGLWISTQELSTLPTSGSSWKKLYAAASQLTEVPSLSDQSDDTNIKILAKALVYARTKEQRFGDQVVMALRELVARDPEAGERTLALGRKLLAYVLAADLIDLKNLDPVLDQRFREELRALRLEERDGTNLVATHEQRPNNWGTHAGASRVAIAAYLHDEAELKRCAQVFKGWLGDRASYAGFKFGELDWQAEATQPVGINPKGAQRNGHSIDGVLPDDQRRSGPFVWPPPRENYVYEALQGALAQAILLHRAGYDVWHWNDSALLRAYQWLYEEAQFSAAGDDEWQMPAVNYFYGAHFPVTIPARPGKNMGWTDWIYAQPHQSQE